MADPAPQSTPTPNYNFNLPLVGGDDNVWGDLLNENWSNIDGILWTVSGVANAALTQAAGDARYLRLTGGTITGATSFPVVVSPLLSGTSGGAPPALINGPNPGDNSQTVPTTSWVNQAVSAAIGAIPAPPSPSNAAPAMNGTAAPGTSALYSRGDHVHPTDTSRYAASNPAGYQTAAQVTAALAPYALTASVPVASSTLPIMDGTAAVGTGATFARADHVHPSDTSRLPLAGGTLTGTLNGTAGVFSGNLTAANLNSNGSITSNTPQTGAARYFVGQSSGQTRWALQLGDTSTQSGANTGCNYILSAYNDAGTTVISNPMSIVRSTGVCTFSAAIINGPSDRTLKENIAPIEGALDKVLALQGVSFNMIATPDKPEIGLIAQDVEPIVPEIIQTYQAFEVATQATSPKLALDYPKLTALLIEAVKTLTARVETLEAQLKGAT